MAELSNKAPVGIILLAAGGSSRLGRPKQLLPYKGQTLLRYSLGEALLSNAQPVVVILGAGAEALQNEVSSNVAHVVTNDDWQEGMASSIRTGINAMQEINPSAEGVIIVMCDQPFLTASLLNDLIAAHRATNKGIVACTYENTFGPPVFFHHSLFTELLQLKGDIGARSIVRQHTDDVEAIPFPDGTIDIDTAADYEKIKEDDVI